MGKPKDPHYWRKWRAAHPEYRQRDAARRVRNRGDRSTEYARRRRPATYESLPQLYPELNHGTAIAFWEDELRMDLGQERVLAVLEGRDPEVAVRAYRRREREFQSRTAPLLEELIA